MKSLPSPRILSIALAQLAVADFTTGATTANRLAVWNGAKWTDQEDLLEPYFSPPRTGGGRYVDSASLAALAAVRALKPSAPPAAPHRRACILGSRSGNAYTIAQCEAARLAGRRMSPLLFAHAGWNVPTALVAAELECSGFTSTLSAGVQSGEKAWYAAWRILDRQRADWAAVGVVALASAMRQSEPGTLQALSLMCLMSQDDDRGKTTLPVTAGLAEMLPGRECLPTEITAFADFLEQRNFQQIR